MIIDLNYKITPIIQLLGKKLIGKKNLDFISTEYLKNACIPFSILSDDENSELGKFLFSLGKSDVNTQLKLIGGFREYIEYSKNQYIEKYNKSSRVYISLGFFSGIVLAIVLI